MRHPKNVIVLVAFLSDHLKLRGTLMLFTLPFAIIGYAVIANTSNAQVGYGMTFLMSTGLYASVPCVLVWNSNNSAGHYKRATTSAMQLAIANCGGFVATFIYPAKDAASLYHRGHTVVLSLLVAAWFLYVSLIPAVTRDDLLMKIGSCSMFFIAAKSTRTRQTESTTNMLDTTMTATRNLFLFCKELLWSGIDVREGTVYILLMPMN